MKKLGVSLFAILFSLNAFAEESTQLSPTTEEILYGEPANTQCATSVFANALKKNASAVSEEDDEQTIQQWIYGVFAAPDVLTSVLACPEMQYFADDESVRFMPIQYTFPNGRQITINYETQPQVLKQRITLGSKRSTEALNDPSPRIGISGDNSIWTNTDPAWYAIMVVQHGALDNFVGPDKNNTISIKYINENIDKLYPRGATCTNKSALADDDYMINVAAHDTVELEDDTNDYYVAGDVNLQWISYTEIALDVAITVITMGGGTVITGITKSARATKVLNGLRNTLKTLSKSPKVVEFVKLEQKLQKTERTLARLRKYKQLERELSALDKVKDAAKYADKAADLEKAAQELRSLDKLTDAAKYSDNIADLEKEGEALTKSMRETSKASKEVQQFTDARKTYSELQKYRRAYKNFRNAKAGNVVARLLKGAKATLTGNKTIRHGAKIARSSMKSGKTLDWLFQSTLRSAGALGRLETKAGALYGAIKFVGDMYDWTETSTGEFTNGVDFKPLLLLSADDIKGQENVINHGMWLMWAGDSTNPADDDAAYLQSFDFADKFHEDLLRTMEEKKNHACNVDIYVVRPVLRNPDTDNPEMYYLIMNDQPWSTAE